MCRVAVFEFAAANFCTPTNAFESNYDNKQDISFNDVGPL